MRRGSLQTENVEENYERRRSVRTGSESKKTVIVFLSVLLLLFMLTGSPSANENEWNGLRTSALDQQISGQQQDVQGLPNEGGRNEMMQPANQESIVSVKEQDPVATQADVKTSETSEGPKKEGTDGTEEQRENGKEKSDQALGGEDLDKIDNKLLKEIDEIIH